MGNIARFAIISISWDVVATGFNALPKVDEWVMAPTIRRTHPFILYHCPEDARGYWLPDHAAPGGKQGAACGKVAIRPCRARRQAGSGVWQGGNSIRRKHYVILSPMVDRIDKLRSQLAQFANERDWDQFHNPKNLAMALLAEAGELIEHFQWLSPQQAANLSAETKSEVALEIADVLLFLLRLADKLDIDPIAAAERKILLNAEKYPVEKSKGIATKYNKL